MDGKTVGIVLVVVLVAGGGWYFLSGTPAEAPAPIGGDAGNAAGIFEENADTSVTVVYTDEGYSPQSVTVPVGGTVTFVNQSSKKMWVASARHPEHTVYSGTSLTQHCPDTSGTAFDQCAGGASGTSYSFTFNKAGEWKYHDHIDATKFGSVVVTAAL